MVSKIHATKEEVTPDKERAPRDLSIAVVIRRASSLLFYHLDMCERSFCSIGKDLVPLRGRPDGVYLRRGSG